MAELFCGPQHEVHRSAMVVLDFPRETQKKRLVRFALSLCGPDGLPAWRRVLTCVDHVLDDGLV